ncbi:hypothetical protein AZE42_07046, partial [Rhizopogon vesiculosus]
GKPSAVETSQQETDTSSLHPTSRSDPNTSSNTTTSILYPTLIARDVHGQRTSHQSQQEVAKCEDDVSGQLGEGNSSANISSINENIAPSHHIRLVPHFDSFRFEPISRHLRDGDTPLRIGRFIDGQDINPVATDKLAFNSKVVSRAHAELWSDDGKINIKDTKSSNGTFVNHIRLSPAGSKSIPHQLKDGDIVQLGTDLQDGQEAYKSVKFTIEIGRESQAPTNDFNSSSHPSSSSNPTAHFDTSASAHSTSNYDKEGNKRGEDMQNEDMLRPTGD